MRSGLLIVIAVFICGSVRAQDGLFAPEVRGQLLVNPSYLVDFDSSGKIPFWVAYELTAEEASGTVGRSDDFRVDDRVANSAPAKWPGSGYDRGHMKPAADSQGSLEEMRSSFLMTNMAPQTPALNRGEWKGVEELVRAWSAQHGKVYVVMGPGDATRGMLKEGVRIPSHFWKAVLRYGQDTTAVAFLFPNAPEVPGAVADYRVTVDWLESFIGMDLFAPLPDLVEARVESEWGEWNLKEKAPRKEGRGSPNEGDSMAVSTRCTGWSKSKGARCSLMTKHPSGRCHHHRD